ncbi:MAG: hypothetical protein ACP6IS_03775 [Candidatus Asgardarchaeia archaeon]
MKDVEKNALREIIRSLELAVEKLDTFTQKWNETVRESITTVRVITDIGFQLLYSEKELGVLEDFPDLMDKLRAKLYMILYNQLAPELEKAYNKFTHLLNITNEIKAQLDAVESLLEKYSAVSVIGEKVIDVAKVIVREIRKVIAMYEKSYEVKTAIRDAIINGEPTPIELTNYFTVWRVEPYIDMDAIREAKKEIDAGLDYLQSIFEEITEGKPFFPPFIGEEKETISKTGNKRKL